MELLDSVLTELELSTMELLDSTIELELSAEELCALELSCIELLDSVIELELSTIEVLELETELESSSGLCPRSSNQIYS